MNPEAQLEAPDTQLLNILATLGPKQTWTFRVLNRVSSFAAFWQGLYTLVANLLFRGEGF